MEVIRVRWSQFDLACWYILTYIVIICIIIPVIYLHYSWTRGHETVFGSDFSISMGVRSQWNQPLHTHELADFPPIPGCEPPDPMGVNTNVIDISSFHLKCEICFSNDP